MKSSAPFALAALLAAGLGGIVALRPEPPAPAAAAPLAAPAARARPAVAPMAGVARPRDSAPALGVADAGPDIAALLAAIDDSNAADSSALFDRYYALIEPLTAQGDFGPARAILQTTPHPQVRAMLVSAFAGIWARHDPAASAAWVAALPPSPLLATALGEIVSTWAARDLPGAAAFTFTLAEGEARQHATTNLLRQWCAQGDLVAASEWLSRVEPHRDFDPAIATLVADPRLLATAPRAASDWLKSIVDERVRADTLARLAGRRVDR